MKNHFSFDRELTNLELLFWKDFFNNFPIISFKKIHSLLDRYINSFDNLNNDFEQIKNLKSKDDLFIFFKQIHGDFSIKTLNFIEQLNPQVSIPEMFLSVIYFAYTEDLDLNITKNGLSYNIENNKLFLNTSYTSEIGMISDLMAGRLQELMPSLQNINPVSLSGEFSIETYLNNEKMVYFLKIEEHDRTFFHSNKNYRIIESK